MNPQFTQSRSDAIRAALIERVARDLHRKRTVPSDTLASRQADGHRGARRGASGALVAGTIAFVLIAGVAGIAISAALRSPDSAATLPAVESTAPFVGSGTVIERDGRVVLCLEGQQQSLPPSCAGAYAFLARWRWDGIAYSNVRDVLFTEHPVTVRGTLQPAQDAADAPTLTLSEPPIAGALISGDAPGAPPTPSGLSDGELQAIVDDLLDGVWPPGTIQVSDGVILATVAYDDGTLQLDLDARYGHGVVYVSSRLRGEVIVQRAGGSVVLVDALPGPSGMEALIGGVLTRSKNGCFTGGDGSPIVFPYGATLLPDGSGVDVPGHGRLLVGEAFEGAGGGAGIPRIDDTCAAGIYTILDSVTTP